MQIQKKSRSRLYHAVTCGIIVGCAAACFPQGDSTAEKESTDIIIRGSKNVMHLVTMWVDTFTRSKDTPTFDIEATGTDEGIADLLAGRAHIAMASRPMTEEERSVAREGDLTLRETVVARMGIAVVVNKENRVGSLAIETLAAIFAGEINNWRSCGGPDQPITIVRKTSGWSPGIFRDRIMGDSEYSDDAVLVDSNEGVIAEVGSRPWTIGFAGMPEAIPALDRVKLIRIAGNSSDADATYALSRPLFVYTNQESKFVEPFLDYVVGTEAQSMIIDTGFYPATQGDPLP